MGRAKKDFNDELGYKSLNLTEKQKLAQEVIDKNTLTFISGPAGTGKTLSVLHKFVQDYTKDVRKKICVLRTPVEAGPDRIGYLKGDASDKLEIHFKSAEHILKSLLNPNKYECDFDKRIKYWVPNFVLGSTWDDSFVLLDEAQQLSPMVMKLLLERIGKHSKCVVCGDPNQLYTTDKNRNGLSDAISRFFDTETKQPLYDDVGWVEFTEDDITRSDICKTVVRAYSR